MNIVLVIALAFSCVVAISAKNLEPITFLPYSCSSVCTKNDPICGKQAVTGQLKDFPSDCQRIVENCYSKPGFDFAYAGLCFPYSCSSVCTENNPICAKHPVTGELKDFPSDCQRIVENCYSKPGYDFAYAGLCFPYSCSSDCTELNDPICGKQQVTEELKKFPSDCQRIVENCYSRPGYDFAYSGVC